MHEITTLGNNHKRDRLLCKSVDDARHCVHLNSNAKIHERIDKLINVWVDEVQSFDFFNAGQNIFFTEIK